MKMELIVIGVTIFLFLSYRKHKIKKEDYKFMVYSEFIKKYGTGI